jgi:hypothetical protein
MLRGTRSGRSLKKLAACAEAATVAAMSTLSIGRTVHYILNSADAADIAAKRAALVAGTPEKLDTHGRALDPWLARKQGTAAAAGETYPAVVTRIASGKSQAVANLRVQLDGCDTHWVSGVAEDDTDAQETPGTWHWPKLTGGVQVADPELDAALAKLKQAPREQVLAAAAALG